MNLTRHSFPWLDVFVTLVGGFNTTGVSQDFFASATNTNTTLETSTVDLVTAIGTVTPAVGASVRVRMACVASGQDTVTLQIDFTGFDSMLIAWSKKCQVTGPHTGFSIATTQWTPASGAAPDVVANGETAPRTSRLSCFTEIQSF